MLHDGVVPTTAAPAAQAPEPRLPDLGQRPPAPGGMTVLFRPDPTVWDGRFANNAWLQECPKPLTKQVWSNAAHVAPEDAKRLGLTDGDLLNLERGSGPVVAPSSSSTAKRRAPSA